MRPSPTEPEILEFLETCASVYPDDAVAASIGQQRQWYDALCARFDRPLPDGMATQDRMIDSRIKLRIYRPS